MTPLPTLRQLQFFMALVRRASFSKAADDCLVSQSTLSSAIKEMEALTGQQLVDRSTRSFALTPAGEEVAARAPALLAGAEDLVRAASGRHPLEGPFTLGVIPTIAPFLLPKATKTLKKAFPKLELYLREDLTATLAERLAAGLVDAAVLAFPYDLPGMDVVEIGDDPFWFACAPDHPLADKKSVKRDDIRHCELLLLEDGHCLREHAIDACELRERDAAASFGGTSLFTIAQMAKAGLGATLLPDMAVKDGLAKSAGLKTIPFAKPAPSRKIGVAWRHGSGRKEEALAMAEEFKKVMT
ncbi:hydrogen peroxide-inducible genes activator [Hyphococcus luteus]|uniref:LysR family transcriptional regulator n=1 Tax=Hyphococcus luteus TaxID=2058213 RepID=A0A2S7K5U0_9PROT|nr:hydrogen peroxide-inducible genes activator [Marinicaulis flavus]PQA87841.1 LysR family transcriptional regulator [Marinicaulis flavus]